MSIPANGCWGSAALLFEQVQVMSSAQRAQHMLYIVHCTYTWTELAKKDAAECVGCTGVFEL